MARPAEPDAPVRLIDLLDGRGGCTQQRSCEQHREQFMSRMIGKYVGEHPATKPSLQSTVIDLAGFSFGDFMHKLRHIHKGNAVRDARKADRAGLVCKLFVWENFIPDVVEINQSKKVRSGGAMKPAYLRSIEELGGAPVRLAPLEPPECPVHAIYSWGAFEPRPGYRQGEVVTDEKLVAYIRFKRSGNLGIYSQILGHGDFLAHGVMHRLHHAIMEWVSANLNGSLRGLDFIMYGAANSGTDGLRMWKKRALFAPAWLALNETKTNAIGPTGVPQPGRGGYGSTA